MANKKDYKAIADALRAMKPEHPEFFRSVTVRAEIQRWIIICEAIANNLALINPCFDRHRFLAACGVETVATEAHAIRKEGTIRERMLGSPDEAH